MGNCYGRNLVYKLSLYSQVRDQIFDTGANNKIELKIRFQKEFETIEF